MRNLFQIERSKCSLAFVEAHRSRIAEAFCIVHGHLVVIAAVLRLMGIGRRDDGELVLGRNLHEVRVRRDFMNRIAVVRTRVDINDHVGLLKSLGSTHKIRRDIKVRQIAEQADVERMAEHIIETRVRELLDFLRIPLVNVFQRMLIPLGLDFRRIIRPAVQEMNGANQIIKIIVLENVPHFPLVLEIADFHANLDIVFLLQLMHKGKVFINRILELLLLSHCC